MIAQETHLDDFKLIYKGAVLKDEKLPLSAYRLRPASTLTLLPIHDPAPTAKASTEKTEQTSLTTIQQELASIRESLLPSLTSFLETLPQEEKLSPALQKEHTRLGELLLQALLRLDAVSANGEWEDARRERKAAVKEVQALLDRLDDAWSSR